MRPDGGTCVRLAHSVSLQRNPWKSALLDGAVASVPGADTTIKWTFGDTQNNLYVLYSFSPRMPTSGRSAGWTPR